MKKCFKYILFALLPIMAVALSSCTDQSLLVRFNVKFAPETRIKDNIIYMVQGETLKILDVELTNLDKVKKANINKVLFDLNNMVFEYAETKPYSVELSSEGATLGEHILVVTCYFKTDGQDRIDTNMFVIYLVESEEQIPPTHKEIK